jgi:hypothetical protein
MVSNTTCIKLSSSILRTPKKYEALPYQICAPHCSLLSHLSRSELTVVTLKSAARQKISPPPRPITRGCFRISPLLPRAPGMQIVPVWRHITLRSQLLRPHRLCCISCTYLVNSELSDCFSQTWILLAGLSKKIANTKFHEYLFTGSRVFPCGQTDGRMGRHDRVIDTSRSFAKTPKWIPITQHSALTDTCQCYTAAFSSFEGTCLNIPF